MRSQKNGRSRVQFLIHVLTPACACILLAFLESTGGTGYNHWAPKLSAPPTLLMPRLEHLSEACSAQALGVLFSGVNG